MGGMYGESAADAASNPDTPLRRGRAGELCSPVKSSAGVFSISGPSGNFQPPREDEGVETHSRERCLSTVRESTGAGTVVTGAAVHACVSMRNTCMPFHSNTVCEQETQSVIRYTYLVVTHAHNRGVALSLIHI